MFRVPSHTREYAAWRKEFATEIADLVRWIKMVRRSCALTQEQLAAYVGVTKFSVRNWENGTRVPGFAHICLIARVQISILGTGFSHGAELGYWRPGAGPVYVMRKP